MSKKRREMVLADVLFMWRLEPDDIFHFANRKQLYRVLKTDWNYPHMRIVYVPCDDLGRYEDSQKPYVKEVKRDDDILVVHANWTFF